MKLTMLPNNIHVIIIIVISLCIYNHQVHVAAKVEAWVSEDYCDGMGE